MSSGSTGGVVVGNGRWWVWIGAPEKLKFVFPIDLVAFSDENNFVAKSKIPFLQRPIANETFSH